MPKSKSGILVYCVDCAHHTEDPAEGHMCDFVPDPVTGAIGSSHASYARRADGLCGTLGVLFDRKHERKQKGDDDGDADASNAAASQGQD